MENDTQDLCAHVRVPTRAELLHVMCVDARAPEHAVDEALQRGAHVLLLTDPREPPCGCACVRSPALFEWCELVGVHRSSAEMRHGLRTMDELRHAARNGGVPDYDADDDHTDDDDDEPATGERLARGAGVMIRVHGTEDALGEALWTAVCEGAGEQVTQAMEAVLAAGGGTAALRWRACAAPGGALTHAVRKGHRVVVEKLAPFATHDDLDEALQFSTCQLNFAWAFVPLLAAGAHPSWSGQHLLCIIAKWGNVALVRAVLPYVDVNAHGERGTPLMWASQYGHLEVVCELIEAGADVNWARWDGWTALMSACSKSHVDVLSCLLAEGADPTVAVRGKSALAWACERKCEQGAELLLRWGARLPGGILSEWLDAPPHVLDAERKTEKLCRVLMTPDRRAALWHLLEQ